jgi:hypothetical protein
VRKVRDKIRMTTSTRSISATITSTVSGTWGVSLSSPAVVERRHLPSSCWGTGRRAHLHRREALSVTHRRSIRRDGSCCRRSPHVSTPDTPRVRSDISCDGRHRSSSCANMSDEFLLGDAWRGARCVRELRKLS